MVSVTAQKKKVRLVPFDRTHNTLKELHPTLNMRDIILLISRPSLVLAHFFEELRASGGFCPFRINWGKLSVMGPHEIIL